jgi:hypothetical protein
LSFIETISVLDRAPRDLGHDRTIVFFNDSEAFPWARPGTELCDVRTGVICSPEQLRRTPDAQGSLPDGVMRITALADYDRLDVAAGGGVPGREASLVRPQYRASAVRFVPDYRRYVDRHGHVHTHGPSTASPGTTTVRFTGRLGKRLDGTTHLDNLFLCGTDQGFVGIVGAIVSGISRSRISTA